MGRWADRLAELEPAEKISAHPCGGTDKTDKRGVLSVLAVEVQGDSEKFLSPANDPADRQAAPVSRPYRLSKIDADVDVAEPWNDAACARFVARVGLFLRRGINATDAEDLGERLHLRDVQGDDRRLCVECEHLAGIGTSGWRCGNHAAAGVGRDLPAELATLPQRCPRFVATTA